MQHHPVRTALTGIFLLIAVCVSFPVQAEEELWEAIQNMELDFDRAVTVESVIIDMEFGSLSLTSGLLIPCRPVAGRSPEWVFQGAAQFSVQPPSKVEAGQLELFTGARDLETEVSRAILVFGGTGYPDYLLSLPAADRPDEKSSEELTAYYLDWVKGPLRHGSEADTALLRALLDHRPYDGHLTAVMDSVDLGEIYLRIDPSQAEPVMLGQFLPPDYDPFTGNKNHTQVGEGSGDGKYFSEELLKNGDWNTWLSSTLAGNRKGAPGFRPVHYDLDVTVTPAEEWVRSTTRIQVEAAGDNARVVSLKLTSSMKVKAVRDGNGTDLFWTRTGASITVVLPEPLMSGDTAVVEIQSSGRVLWEDQKTIYALRSTLLWYPNLGPDFQATYDARFHWPARLQLIAAGELVEESLEKGTRHEHRKVTTPTLGYSFEVGKFILQEAQFGHVQVRLAISKRDGTFEIGIKEGLLLATIGEALEYFEENYSPYPLDYLTVVTVPRGFSQSLLGFVTLSHVLIHTPSGYYSFRNAPWQETVAHEVAHQWWGHLVRWDTYRDQWLSESLADYSSNRFLSEQGDSAAVYLTQHARRWRNTLDDRTRSGRTIESLGPVVLGHRLNSSYSDRAWQAIAYDKGSQVFRMMARTLGQEPFDQMLGSLAGAVAGRQISTETFLKAIEKMSGTDLAWYADRYVYGTGIPEVYYSYDYTEEPDGNWLVQGTARQISVPNYHYRIDPTATGGWDVSREALPSLDISDSTMAVPFQITLENAGEQDGEDDDPDTTRGFGGTIVLDGAESPFEIRIEEKPDDFLLDQRGEVLAYFYSENLQPKRTLRYQGEQAASSRRFEEAEALFRKALDTPYVPAVSRWFKPNESELRASERYRNGRLHLRLARLYLDQNKTDMAEKELKLGVETFTRDRKGSLRYTRMILEARIACQRGDYQELFRLLDGELRLKLPPVENEYFKDQRMRHKYGQGYWGNGEAYSLLAIGASQVGNDFIAGLAAKEAARRGTDPESLEALLGAD